MHHELGLTNNSSDIETTPYHGENELKEGVLEALEKSCQTIREFQQEQYAELMKLINSEALKLARYLRNNNKRVDFDTESKSLKSQFKKSDNLNSRYLIFINDEKLKYGKVEIKDTLNSIKEEIEIDKILEYLK